MEVRAPDAVGVLHKVTAAIAAQGLDISSARVTTLGNAVVDTFYVRSGGRKLKGNDAAERLQAAHRRCARGHRLRAALVTQPKHSGCGPETTALYGLVEPTAAWSRGEAYLLLREGF